MALSTEPCERDIFAAVSQLELGGSPVSLDAQFRGGQCRVYKLSFVYDADQQKRRSIAVRVPIFMTGALGIISVLRTEWETLQALQEKGFPWSPVPLGCCLTFDNPMKYPFLVLTWGEGAKAR